MGQLMPAVAAARAWLRAMAGLIALLAASACASDPPRPAPAAGWHVVERLGHARFQPPGASEWLHVATAGHVPAGSRVITGRGGRLILAAGERQIVAGTAAEFRLSDLADRGWMTHRAGQVRYRVPHASGEPITIETPFVQIEVASAVLDVSVGPERAEVRVEDGAVRVVTPDRLAGTTLLVGQAALAERKGREYLLVRQGRDGSREAVAPMLVAALARAITPTPASEAKLVVAAAHAGGGVPPDAVAAAAPAPGLAVALPAGKAAPAPGAEASRQVAEPQLLALSPGATVRPATAPSPPKPLDEGDRIADQVDADGPVAGSPDRGTENWSGLPSKRTNVVIVPARSRTPQALSGASAETGSLDFPGSSAQEMHPSLANRADAAGSGGTGAEPGTREARQIPFDELGAGLLDELPPAASQPSARPGLVPNPARRL